MVVGILVVVPVGAAILVDQVVVVAGMAVAPVAGVAEAVGAAVAPEDGEAAGVVITAAGATHTITVDTVDTVDTGGMADMVAGTRIGVTHTGAPTGQVGAGGGPCHTRMVVWLT